MKEMLKAVGIALLMLLAIVLYSLLPEEQQVLERLVRQAEQGEVQQDDDKPAVEQDAEDQHELRLDADRQAQSGIRIAQPLAMELNDEVLSYAQVVDVLPLLEAQSNYHRTLAERDLIQTSLNSEAAVVKRLRLLLQEQTSITGSQLREAEARLAYQRTRLNAVRQAIQDLRLQIQQTWGVEVSTMLLDDNSALFAGLLSGQTVLLRLVLPVDSHLAEGIQSIAVSRNLQRQQASTAALLSAALTTDPLVQGETWYFTSSADQYRSGMRLNAWVPQSTESRAGLLLPGEAVVWYAGKPWVYRRVDGEVFERVPLVDFSSIEGGLFVEQGLEATDEIVISGGQMLLSEEYRWQIPAEDDDD